MRRARPACACVRSESFRRFDASTIRRPFILRRVVDWLRTEATQSLQLLMIRGGKRWPVPTVNCDAVESYMRGTCAAYYRNESDQPARRGLPPTKRQATFLSNVFDDDVSFERGALSPGERPVSTLAGGCVYVEGGLIGVGSEQFFREGL